MPELAALAALPQDLAVPGLDRARAKAMPSPVQIPSGGRNVKVLGRSQVGGHSVGLNVVDARQHMHVIGKTGTGKSTLMLNMILGDVKAGRGTVVIDPRGDLVTDILDRLPASYADRIVIIDPDQPNPGCFNPLDDSGDPHLAVDNLVGIFAKIFGRHWGPRIDDTLRVACLTLMRHATPTLSLVPPLLNDRSFRARFTHDLDDPDGLGGFWVWYDNINDALRGQVIGPVLARLRQFLMRPFVKAVIGPAYSSFQMSDVLDGGLLLCRLPKGILGEETSRILGSLIVARTWQAAIARAATPEDHRKDATLYIDECHNFLTLPGSVDDMLAEARGYRLGLVLAHQDLAQLPTETAAALSANARSKVFFNVDPGDAPGAVPAHQAGAGRARPVAPGRVHRRRPAAGRQPGAAGVHVHHPPAGRDRGRGDRDPAGVRRRPHPADAGATHAAGRPQGDAPTHQRHRPGAGRARREVMTLPIDGMARGGRSSGGSAGGSFRGSFGGVGQTSPRRVHCGRLTGR